MKKRFTNVFIILCIIIILLIISIPIIITCGNDRFAENVVSELKSTPLPSNTEIVANKSIAGKLSGNGNGMQYLGVIVVKSELNNEQLNTYYNNYRENSWDFCISSIEGSDVDITDRQPIHFKELENLSDYSHYYAIYSWGESPNSFFWDLDLRGH